ncbi:MAG: hypothetical protein AABW68_00925, partial [archaeon]
MSMNPILVHSLTWVAGVAAAYALGMGGAEVPSLLVVMGFLFMGFFSGWMFFGKLSPILLAVVGFMEGSWVFAFPIAGVLLGICTIAAGLYGKTLGYLALEDVYENAQTRLPGYLLAALINLAIILGCGIVVGYLFPLLPDAGMIKEWLPLAGLGV